MGVKFEPSTGRKTPTVQTTKQGPWEADMNHSFYSADRMTQLKIVVVAIVAAIGVAGFSISAHVTKDLTQTARASGPAIKATKTIAITSSEQPVIR
jgi:hypothetical protein